MDTIRRDYMKALERSAGRAFRESILASIHDIEYEHEPEQDGKGRPHGGKKDGFDAHTSQHILSGDGTDEPRLKLPPPSPTARGILAEVDRIQQERAVTRDASGGERSMAKAVEIFHAITGSWAEDGTPDIYSEKDGWLFLMCLKLARMQAGGFHADDYYDLVGYASLLAECALKEHAHGNS